MATGSSLLGRGLGLVLVEFEYEYEGRDGELVSIKPNERYVLLAKTNDHWWQVRRDSSTKPFYIPAKYVKELPADFPSPLDFTDTPPAEPAPLPVAAPVPVPVPVPKPLEETRPKAGDEVTIRLRPDASTRYHKTENRMSTFGVPLDFHDPSPTRHPINPHAGPTETRSTAASETSNMVDKLLDDHIDSGKSRVPSFSPADPLPVTRPHTQAIPVEMPVVPPLSNVHSVSSSSTDPQNHPEEEEVEEELVEEEVSTDESVEDLNVEVHREEEDSHHIYESIQDLNLDLEALVGERGTPGVKPEAEPESEPAPPSTKEQASLAPISPIYANISSLKKTSPPVVCVSGPPGSPQQPPTDSTPPTSDHTPSSSGHTPSSSVSSSGLISPASPVSPQDGWQAHTDQDSGKVFYYHPLTRQTTWSQPHSPPPPPGREVDESSGREMTSPSPLLSPASSQVSSGWEQLMDEASGRFYYYNPTTGATSWSAPDLTPASSPPGSSSGGAEDGPPPLPAEDYPVSDTNDNVFTTTQQSAGLIPRAHLDPKDSSSVQRRQQEFLLLPQRLMGNGVSEDGLQVKNWRHSVAEDSISLSHRRNVSDFAEIHRKQSPDSPPLSDRLKLRRNLSDRSTGSQHRNNHLLEKAGILNKTKVADNGKKIRKNWSQSWTVLHGGILTFHRDPKSAPAGNASKASQIVPEYTVELRGSSVSWTSNKSSKKNVLELKTRQGCEYLMQYDTESIICDWYKVILDTIKQLEQEHISEDEDELSDKEDKDRKRTTSRSSAGPESEQRRVRTKLRRFLQRRPTLQSVREKGYIRDNVFGCHLDILCHRENTTIPKFVEKCIRTVERRGLDVDGIYRVSGNLAVIQKLRHKADHEEQLDLEDGQWEEIHVVTGALKLFLRELPEPIFPFSCFDKFIAAIQVPDYSLRVSYMKDLVQTLPLPNHDTMELLFRHLRKVIDHGDSNRMSVQSVAIVFGPTLLRPQTESSNMTIHMVFQSQIVELLLKEYHTVFSQR